MIHDFLLSFPWAITLVLMVSLMVAELLVPFMQFYFIRKPMPKQTKHFSFMDMLQNVYDKLLDLCFAWPKTVLAIGAVSIIAGVAILSQLPQKLLPTAERNQFAVEVYMPTGTSLPRTVQVADSVAHILRRDDRVVSVASFYGTSSPRFHNSYAPQLGGSNYAQLIVNTKGNKETEEVLDEYAPRYADAFPQANIRFKQLAYSSALNPIEVRIQGDNLDMMHTVADSVATILRQMPQLTMVRIDLNEPLAGVMVNLKEDEASRLGITNYGVEQALAMHYSSGVPLGAVWEGDYSTPVVLKGEHADSATTEDLGSEQVPAYMGMADVPLRQIADVQPSWHYGQISHRNGVRTISVTADLARGVNGIKATQMVTEKINKLKLPQGTSITYGGDVEENGEFQPQILMALYVAVAIIFVILLWHFKRVSTAFLLLASLTLCLFGAAAGIWIQGVDVGVTCTLGLISLMGILVRNGIIMIDYAEELRRDEHMFTREAIYHSAKRRMRPIFLTSAAASMGVIPMILGGSGLWMPMGTVIFYGTLITMVFILTVIPVAYWKLMTGGTKRRKANEALELQ